MGVSLGVWPVYCYETVSTTAVSALLSVVGLQAWAGASGNALNPSLWTVSSLLFCYAWFPTLLAWLRIKQPNDLLRLLVQLGMSSIFLVIASIGLAGLDWVPMLHQLPPIRLLHFVMGMVAARLARRSDPLAYSPGIVADTCSAVLLLNTIACAASTSLAPYTPKPATSIDLSRPSLSSNRCSYILCCEFILFAFVCVCV